MNQVATPTPIPFASFPTALGLVISVKVEHAEVCRIDLDGEIDLATASDLTAVIEQVSPVPGRVLVLDAARVTFCDCAGLTALLVQHRRLRDGGGALAIVYPPPVLRRLLDAVGLADEFYLWPRQAS
jgi:anti-sigma B factor antagonist